MLIALMSSKKITLIFFLLLVVISPFFFIGGPNVYSTALFRALWDCGHILFFSGLVVVIKPFVKMPEWRFGILLSIVVFVVGGAIEIIQAHTGRDGNWQDLLRDLAGTWLGLFWLQKANALVWAGRLLTLLLLSPSIWTVFLAAIMQWQSAYYFPVLTDFEHFSDLQRWKGHVEISEEQKTQGKNSLKMFFNTQRYSPVAIDEYLGDWTNYKFISFDIYNPQEQGIELVFRINDVDHDKGKGLYTDRFNRKLTIEHGWNHFDIGLDEVQHAPEKRLMNMQEIKRIVFFTSKLQEPKILYLDNVLLK